MLPIHALCKTDVSWDGRDGCNAHALYEHSLGSTRWPMLEDLVLNANMPTRKKRETSKMVWSDLDTSTVSFSDPRGRAVGAPR